MTPFGKLKLTLVLIGILKIISFESNVVLGLDRSRAGASHQCNCVYNKTHPNGHCACIPPLPGSGYGFGGSQLQPTPNGNNPTGTVNCECVYNRTHPRGHCTCDSELCYNDICVSG